MNFEGMEVDVARVLRSWGIVGQITGEGQMYTHCPFHEDSNPSFGINLKTGLWICFSGCGRGNLLTLATKLGKSRLAAEVDMFSEAVPVEPAILLETLRKLPTSGSLVAQRPPLPQNLPQDTDFRFDVVPRWFLERGYTPAMIKRWGIGYDANDKAIVIPVYDDDRRRVAVIKRFGPSSPHKYLYTKGFQRAMHLFGMDRIERNPEAVVLVEGALDCIWVWEHWGPALAILGSDMSEWQTAWVQGLGPSEIILCFCLLYTSPSPRD